MKINYSENKPLDLKCIKDFYLEGDPIISESWAQIKSVKDISNVVGGEYGTDLTAKLVEIKSQNTLLLRLTDVISEVISEPWEPIKKINIYVGACPIAPRFLETNSFLLPYYHDLPILINWSTHEIIHFLYFKKWAKIFIDHKQENFEHPDPVWVLSEILVTVIGNDKRIKDIIKSDFNIYPDWQNIKVDNKSLTEIFTEIYKKSDTFNEFLKKSWDKYQGLDKNYKLTKKLT